LRDAGFIVFLNKQDLLQSKLEAGNCIGDHFTEYFGYSMEDDADGNPKDEYIKTRCFIRDMFLVRRMLVL